MPPAPSRTTRQPTRRTSFRKWGLLLVLIGVLVLVFSRQQAIADWVRQYGYQPSAGVSALARDDTFTPHAEHLYLINRPAILAKQQFAAKCSNQQEQTIVLGCYHGYERGIYVLRIADDSRLNGVEQVTAAHEMLHAAYDRLSSSDKQKVDAMLQDYYNHDLQDQRIKDTIAAYKKTEPDALVNEMHSIFGTEIASLPAPLESYYKQYFTNRSVIAGFAAKYQAEFTQRQQQVAADDARLASLKATIDHNEAALKSQASQLNSRMQQMNQLKNSGQFDAYNAAVAGFNADVNSYNTLVSTTRSQIAQYNQLLSERNAIALEQQQLTSELSGDGVTSLQKQ